ncbi:MAG TPA: hypothetical protein VGI54_01485 [Solirubrobacteraceae bacterium]|jgi:Flp pilus assembly pilin Flp
MRSERGQTSVEWLGLMAVVVALIAIAVGLMPDVANTIKDAVVHEIKAVVGG